MSLALAALLSSEEAQADYALGTVLQLNAGYVVVMLDGSTTAIQVIQGEHPVSNGDRVLCKTVGKSVYLVLNLTGKVDEFVWGTATGTTDASGNLVVNHGMTVAPGLVIPALLTSNTTNVYVTAVTATQFTLTFRLITTAGAPVRASIAVTCPWVAWR